MMDMVDLAADIIECELGALFENEDGRNYREIERRCRLTAEKVLALAAAYPDGRLPSISGKGPI